MIEMSPLVSQSKSTEYQPTCKIDYSFKISPEH